MGTRLCVHCRHASLAHIEMKHLHLQNADATWVGCVVNVPVILVVLRHNEERRNNLLSLGDEKVSTIFLVAHFQKRKNWYFSPMRKNHSSMHPRSNSPKPAYYSALGTSTRIFQSMSKYTFPVVTILRP